MDTAWELGLTTFDTADAYGGGREAWIGEWLATKGSAVRDAIDRDEDLQPDGRGEDHGLSRSHVRQLDSSLQRLGIERVALYLAHEFDPDTPHEETLAAFDELVPAGKIGAAGASNFTAEQLALKRSRSRSSKGSTLRVGAELVLSPRSCRRGDGLPVCHEHGLGYEAFGPLAGAGSRASTDVAPRTPRARA